MCRQSILRSQRGQHNNANPRIRCSSRLNASSNRRRFECMTATTAHVRRFRWAAGSRAGRPRARSGCRARSFLEAHARRLAGTTHTTTSATQGEGLRVRSLPETKVPMVPMIMKQPECECAYEAACRRQFKLNMYESVCVWMVDGDVRWCATRPRRSRAGW